MKYSDFLKRKSMALPSSGFEAQEVNSNLFEWQKDIVKWALKKGKAALFEDCGLGKTIQQLAWAEQVCLYTKGSVLILTPLSVAIQTQKEGEKFGIDVNYCRNGREVRKGINVTNYEMLSHFCAKDFEGIILDESSILKNYSGKTKQQLVDAFRDTPYKLCCTATPAPNDFVEIGNHAEFLGIMNRSEMLATYFIHDGADTSKWRLKGHAEDKFFEWVASWACCMTSPEDIGYLSDEYTLPPLNIIEHVVKNKYIEDDNGQTALFSAAPMSLSERRKARKESIQGRTSLAADIANNISGQCLIWCDLNEESRMLSQKILNSVEVKGSDSDIDKTNNMVGFSCGKVKKLISKPSIAGWGMNWQNCNEIIFVGISDSFEAYYQAVRRCWRFGQKNPVNVHIIISEAEGAIRDNIIKKQRASEKMSKELIKYTKDILLNEIKSTVRVSENYFAEKPITIPCWIGVVE